MSCLGAEADRVVREAVDAYFEGHFRAALDGEQYFETRNSRYRLMDGIVFAASDSGLIGAGLVGWLVEDEVGPRMHVAWRDGARAIFVDRTREQHIIITSVTRFVREVDALGSNRPRGGSVVSQRPRSEVVTNTRSSNPDVTPPPSPRIPALPPLPPPIIRPSSPPMSGPRTPVHAPPRPIRPLVAAPPSTVPQKRVFAMPVFPPAPRAPAPLAPPRSIPILSKPLVSDDLVEDDSVDTERDPTERHDRASLPLAGPTSGRPTFAPMTVPTPSSEPILRAQRR